MHQQNDPESHLVPQPEFCQGGVERLNLSWDNQVAFIGAQDAQVQARAEQLLGGLPVGSLSIEIADSEQTHLQVGVDESYTLGISSTGVEIVAATKWGALHGITSLWQLLAQESTARLCWQIRDNPRFAWRGVLIDVARHFVPVEILQQVVDGMARLKMNVLHLHLSDDQGFRFPSQAFPKLTSKQHYSETELQDLVAYATQLGVRVVPELDVPGHVTSWLVAYPEWGVQSVAATRKFGVHKACLDPTSEDVYAALDTLFDELAAVFPDDYVHIGGDEVHPAWWRTDEKIQAFITAEQLQDERGLQAYFNRRVVTGLLAKGKQAVGWDEVLHEQMPDLVVQNWRGATTRDRVLEKQLDCIVSAGFYLDLFYPADVYYRYDPGASQADLLAQEDDLRRDVRFAHVKEGLAWTDQWREAAIELDAVATSGSVVGGEACLWAELVDARTLFVRLFSRLPAVAERLWSVAVVVDERVLNDFYRRMEGVLSLAGLNVSDQQQSLLLQSGLRPEQLSVANLLEPVKWYTRLLGEQALQARLMGKEMPQARPYDVDTPLDKVVDGLAPESLAARNLQYLDRDRLLKMAQGWQRLNSTDWPADMRKAIDAFAQLGELVASALDASVSSEALRQDLLALYEPQGEYMLAAIPPLLNRFVNEVADVG